jgi:hypothetical protein
MKKLAFGLLVSLIGLVFGLTWLVPVSVQAAPQPQYTAFPTPTPGSDGRILYLVQSGDTLYRIASISGVSVDELRQLNNLGTGDVLIAGTYILLGLGGPVEPTNVPLPGGQQGDIQVTPTPTEVMENGEICVLLFIDANGNTIFEEGDEYGMGDGEVSVTERLGAYSEKRTTELSVDPIVPTCFENVPPGTYLVSMAIPEGFNRTTDLSTTIELVSGATAFINFGMQPDGDLVSATSQQSQQSANNLVGILGVTFLLVGAGVGIYSAISNRGGLPERG